MITLKQAAATENEPGDGNNENSNGENNKLQTTIAKMLLEITLTPLATITTVLRRSLKET